MRRDFEWDLSDRFLSNRGHGPLVARILCIVDDVAKMERWHKKSGPQRAVRFNVPVKYLMSDNCGWRKQEPTDEQR